MKKKIILFCLLIIGLFTVSSCSVFDEKLPSIFDNSTYIIKPSTIDTYTEPAEDDQAMVVASKVMPAVVEITTTINYSYKAAYTGIFGTPQSQTIEKQQSGKATGFIINDEGYVLTNAHVVTIEKANEYNDFKYLKRTIKLNYADTNVYFDAEIVSYDVDKDLCILKMDTSKIKGPLPYVTFLNLTNPLSDDFQKNNCVKLYYGETAIAIGNALGYGISVTKGVVSAPVRVFNNNNEQVFAIQTDAAINEGNSGGPLSNKYGLVIGINSFKIVTTTSESLGFAIPTYVILDYISMVEQDKNINITVTVTNESGYKNIK